MSDAAAIDAPAVHGLARAVLALDYDAMSPAAVAKTKQILLYHTCLAFFSLQAPEREGELALAVERELGLCDGPCTIIGHRLRAQPIDAAYVNCFLMRGVGRDDVLFPSGMHAGLMLIPTAMAIAEQRGRGGRAFIAAIAAGYELLGKVGRWSWSSPSPRRPSTIFGPMAVAATAAQLMDLDERQAATALGYAAHAAMGLPANLNAHIYGSLCRAGLLSAAYGKAGGECPPDILEGELGFFRCFFDGPPPSAEALLSGFGREPLAVFMSRDKRYPGTLLNTVAIELTRALVHQHGLNAGNVAAVSYKVSDGRRRHPTGQLRPPYRRAAEASASLPFQAALLLLDGELLPSRYERLDDPHVLDLLPRIEVGFTPHENPFYAAVTLRRSDGAEFSAEGEDHVFAPLDAERELREQARSVLDDAQITRFLALVDRLETLEDLSALFACLVPAT